MALSYSLIGFLAALPAFPGGAWQGDMRITDLQLDGWGTHQPPEAWPVSRWPPFCVCAYSLRSLFFPYIFFSSLHQWCLEAKPPGFGSAERGVTNNPVARGVPAAAKGAHTAGDRVPGVFTLVFSGSCSRMLWDPVRTSPLAHPLLSLSKRWLRLDSCWWEDASV